MEEQTTKEEQVIPTVSYVKDLVKRVYDNVLYGNIVKSDSGALTTYYKSLADGYHLK